jgi:hypothetical protein
MGRLLFSTTRAGEFQGIASFCTPFRFFANFYEFLHLLEM